MFTFTGVKEESKWLQEDIGLYSIAPLEALLQPLAESYPYRFSSHSNFDSLHCWILTQRPQMIILEGESLASARDDQLEILKETLIRWGIISLIISESVEEIHQWRRMNWPRVHFYYGPPSGEQLQKKVVDILSERYLWDQPSVTVVTDKTYLLSHLEMILRLYGIRLQIIGTDGKSASPMARCVEPVVCTFPEALLWDVHHWQNGKGPLVDEITSLSQPIQLPHFLISEEKKDASFTDPLPPYFKSTTVFTPDTFDQLMLGLMDAIFERRQKRVHLCRDGRTGFYHQEIFQNVVLREMAMAERRGEDFSILKFSLESIEKVEKKYGFIFKQALEANLALFIQNRVRASDFVAMGNQGEVLVLLSRVGRQLASLVGERLCHRFAKEATFQDNGADHLFSPKLSYQIFCYPHDIRHMNDLKQALKGEGKFSAKGLKVSQAFKKKRA